MSKTLSSPSQTPYPRHLPSTTDDNNPTTPTQAAELTAHLDALLEQYLDLLDKFTSLRESLCQDLSAGYLNLAHANRTSNLGAGRRYGEEGYDERMKAGRVVRIRSRDPADDDSDKGKVGDVIKAMDLQGPRKEDHDQGDESEEYLFEITQHVPQLDQSSPGHNTSQPPASSARPQSSDSPSHDPTDKTFNDNEPLNSPAQNPPPTTATKNPKAPTKPRDPLNWYGILVPPALRTAQDKFTSALTHSIPSLSTTITSMRRVERQIWLTRAKMGVVDGYPDRTGMEVELDHDGGDEKEKGNVKATTNLGDNKTSVHDQQTKSVQSPNTTVVHSGRKQRLVAKSGEPRSRVIKLE